MPAFPPRSVLVPMDFSEPAMAGLEAAKALGRRWGARLTLLHVNDSTPAHLFQNVHGPADEDALRAYADGLRRRLAGNLEDYPDSEVQVLEGALSDAVQRAEREADLVVMGTHGARNWRRWLTGSVAESVVAEATRPVLTVHEPPGPAWPSRILAPMKFIDYADHALAWALGWAESLDATVTVLHVVELGTPRPQSLEALEEHLRHLLGEKRFEATRRLLAFGDPVSRIVEEAAAGAFDLVVLAEHHRAWWEGGALGTTAEKVLRRAEIPVLSVPATPRAWAERGPSASALLRTRLEPGTGKTGFPPPWVGGKLY